MKHPKKIQWVKAEQESGCGVACIAMILGMDYWSVAEKFQLGFDRRDRGLTPKQAMQFICDHGLTAVTKTVENYDYKDQHRKEMLRPFADIHLVSFLPFFDSKSGHAVVMLKNAKILDPMEKPWPVERYYFVRYVTGFWY